MNLVTVVTVGDIISIGMLALGCVIVFIMAAAMGYQMVKDTFRRRKRRGDE